MESIHLMGKPCEIATGAGSEQCRCNMHLGNISLILYEFEGTWRRLKIILLISNNIMHIATYNDRLASV